MTLIHTHILFENTTSNFNINLIQQLFILLFHYITIFFEIPIFAILAMLKLRSEHFEIISVNLLDKRRFVSSSSVSNQLDYLICSTHLDVLAIAGMQQNQDNPRRGRACFRWHARFVVFIKVIIFLGLRDHGLYVAYI